MSVRPCNDWVRVRLEPEQKSSSALFLVKEDRVRLGIVLSTGPGRINEKGIMVPVDVKVGEKVAFFREHLEHSQGKTIVGNLDDGTALIREMDILFVITPEADVRVSA